MQVKSEKELLKQKILSNSMVLGLKETLKKKILKQQQKDFKNHVQNFLQNPSQSLSKIQVNSFDMNEVVKRVKTHLSTLKEQDSKLKIIIQNEVLLKKSNKNDIPKKTIIIEDEDDEENGLIQNKYGEEKIKIQKQNSETISQSLNINEEQNNKVFYQRILKKLKEDILSEMENILVSKSKYAYKHGGFLLKFIKNFKNQKRDSLQKLSINFFEIPSMEDLRKDLQELNNDKYEHIEQRSECEEVEIERIDEASQIFNDSEKKQEEQEYLSFLKAGVPNSQRVQFYNNLYDIIVKNNKEQINQDQVKQFVDYIQLVDKRLGELLLKSLDFAEYFVYEKMMRQIFAYYLQNYKLMNSSPFESYLGYFPFPGIESLIILASANCMSYKNNKKMFKILHNQIFKPMYNFDCENKENFFALCHFFEKNFLEQNNALYIHLRLIGVYPVNYASKWMSSIFINYLSHDQILLLIDRILGFETLYILPIFSLGVFKYYADDLMQCQKKDEVEDLLYMRNLSAIKIINIQLFEEEDNIYGEDEDQLILRIN